MKYNKIALIGMMGSGKSAVAKILAKRLNYKLIELDEIFEQQQNTTISNFFKKFGEEKFRQIESNILKNSLEDNSIISTGGGIILKQENRNLLFSENILTIYLKASSEIIYDRIKNDKSRPLLLVENPKKEIENIIKKRESYYNQAKIKINTDDKTIDKIVEEIWKKLQ